MVDERQLTRDVLDNLFEKTHCDCNVDWCLYEIYTELQIGKSHPPWETVLQKHSFWSTVCGFVGLLYDGFGPIIKKNLVQGYKDLP